MNGGKDVFAWWVRYLRGLDSESLLYFADKNQPTTMYKCCKGRYGVLWINCPDWHDKAITASGGHDGCTASRTDVAGPEAVTLESSASKVDRWLFVQDEERSHEGACPITDTYLTIPEEFKTTLPRLLIEWADEDSEKCLRYGLLQKDMEKAENKMMTLLASDRKPMERRRLELPGTKLAQGTLEVCKTRPDPDPHPCPTHRSHGPSCLQLPLGADHRSGSTSSPRRMRRRTN